jgi:hypothetical protein
VKPLHLGSDAYITSTVSDPEDNSATYEQAVSSPGERIWEEAINVEHVQADGSFQGLRASTMCNTLCCYLDVHACVELKKERGIYMQWKHVLQAVGMSYRHVNVAKYTEQCEAKGLKQVARKDREDSEVLTPTAGSATFASGVVLKLLVEVGSKVWKLRWALYGL